MLKDKASLTIPLVMTLVFLFIFPGKVFGGFPFWVTKNESMKLLKGEKKLSFLYRWPDDVDSDFKNQIISDLDLKFKIIGQEPTEWEWWHPFLGINLTMFKVYGNRYSGYMEISFNKAAIFAKENIMGYAVVWCDGITFSNARKDNIRQCAKDLLDKFLTVYLKANSSKYVQE